MRCTANIDESEVGKIRTGQDVKSGRRVPTETFVGQGHPGPPPAGRRARTWSPTATVIDVPNPGYKLKPGMTANVTIEINKRHDVVRVPNTAIRFRPTAESSRRSTSQCRPRCSRGGRGAGGTARRQADGRRRGGARAGQGAPPAAGRAAGAGCDAAGAGGRPRRGAAVAARRRRATAPGAPGTGRVRRGPPGRPRDPGTARRRRQAVRGRAWAASQPLPAARVARAWRRARRRRRPRVRPNDPEATKRMSSATRRCRPTRRRRRHPDEGPRDRHARRLPGAPSRARRPPEQTAAQWPTGTTIDALFGPLPPRVSQGRVYVWLPNEKKLKAVRLRLGITDGPYSELLEGEIPRTRNSSRRSRSAPNRPTGTRRSPRTR